MLGSIDGLIAMLMCKAEEDNALKGALAILGRSSGSMNPKMASMLESMDGPISMLMGIAAEDIALKGAPAILGRR